MQCMFCAFLVILGLVSINAQQEPIYVPFAWNKLPITGTPIRTSGPTTTYILLEESDGSLKLGPATLIQEPSRASMTYVAPSTTLSGVCNLRSPIAICTLNVYESGQSTETPRTVTTSSKERGATGGVNSSSAGDASSIRGLALALVSVILGFVFSVALLR